MAGNLHHHLSIIPRPPAARLCARTHVWVDIPVRACEGRCIRGEIARLAANLVANDVPSLARACHAETFFVPHSAMARWVTQATQTVMIGGCFLKATGGCSRH